MKPWINKLWKPIRDFPNAASFWSGNFCWRCEILQSFIQNLLCYSSIEFDIWICHLLQPTQQWCGLGALRWSIFHVFPLPSQYHSPLQNQKKVSWKFTFGFPWKANKNWKWSLETGSKYGCIGTHWTRRGRKSFSLGDVYRSQQKGSADTIPCLCLWVPVREWSDMLTLLLWVCQKSYTFTFQHIWTNRGCQNSNILAFYSHLGSIF